MTQTTRPHYLAMARERVGDLEEKRGLVAAELEACETELAGLRGELPYSGGDTPRRRRGALAFGAILGDEGAAAELEADAERESYLERRAALCKDALAHADERIEGQRRTWLQGRHAATLPLEEVPEVLRERIRAARERNADA